ncbi:MAG: hypothetical protein WBS54_03050 [Acidobacteriota bacterium]
MNRRKPPLAPFSPPPPPHELRGRALAAAEAAWKGESVEVRSPRVRFTRWDWAWAAGLALLLLGNLLVDGRSRRSAVPPAVTNQEKAEIAELARVGIALPEHHRAPQRPRMPREVEDLPGAAGADF